MKRSTRDNTNSRRPRAAEPGTLVGVRLQRADLEALDAYRAAQRPPPTRPEAIRRILAEALQASTEIIQGDRLNASNDK